MTHLVAVYGSLRKGMGNHRLLSSYNANLRGVQHIRGWLLISLGAFPCIVPSACVSDTVEVEVYEVSTVCLSALDGLEGIERNFYERVLVNTKWGRTYIYQYHPESFVRLLDARYQAYIPLVESGVWTGNPTKRNYISQAMDRLVAESYLQRADAIMLGAEDDDGDPVGACCEVTTEADVDEEVEVVAEPIVVSPYREIEYDIPVQEDMNHADVPDPAF